MNGPTIAWGVYRAQHNVVAVQCFTNMAVKTLTHTLLGNFHAFLEINGNPHRHLTLRFPSLITLPEP